MNIQKIKFEKKHVSDKPGFLYPINIHEINKKLNLNFKINNLFYITELNSINSRGKHANKNTSEIIICIKGKFDLFCFDGKTKTKYILNSNEAIYIPKMIWLDFNNFKDCIILVLTNIEPVIEKESIYNIQEYINIMNKNL